MTHNTCSLSSFPSSPTNTGVVGCCFYPSHSPHPQLPRNPPQDGWRTSSVDLCVSLSFWTTSSEAAGPQWSVHQWIVRVALIVYTRWGVHAQSHLQVFFYMICEILHIAISSEVKFLMIVICEISLVFWFKIAWFGFYFKDNSAN